MASINPTVLLESGHRGASRSLIARRTAVVAGAFLLIWGISLSRNLFDPPGYDQAYYQYATERVMAGDKAHALYWAYNGMGSYIPHYLATVLAGTAPWSLRVFDAFWQMATMSLLVWLGGRDGGRWRTGWLAALLYALVYYGSGFLHTAQREAFAVLPLLILVHAVITGNTHAADARRLRTAILYLLAGAAGVFAFSLKPPLGICYGVAWLWVSTRAWNRRREGWSTFIPWLALTLGFVITALAGAMLLHHFGLWSSYHDAFSLGGQMPKGYVRGPALVRALLPYTAPAILILSLLIVGLMKKGSGAVSRRALGQWAICAAGAGLVFGLMLLNQRSPEFHGPFSAMIGLFIPGVAAVLIARWSDRSRVWQACLLMTAAAFAGVCFQGWFFVYHMLPFFAFLTYLVANEIVEHFEGFARGTNEARAWTLVCLAGVVHLGMSHWGHCMTLATTRPYVLSGMSLIDHYDMITKHQPRYPTFGTSSRVAERIRSLTNADDPIALLFREPRIYQLAGRPPAHPLLVINEWTAPLFPDFLRTIEQRRPKVVVAHLPEAVRGKNDPAEVAPALLADVEEYFGPGARFIRKQYLLTEVIGDVGILQPRTPAPG
jgi:hypothetical protein